MGYYTYYTISIDGYTGELPEEEFVSEQLEYGNPFEESCKWYDNETDMKKISEKYPEMVFHLHGDGEETGDLWDKHFKNGKMQLCKGKITYDEYDESKLV
jgi:hypothetical protein